MFNDLGWFSIIPKMHNAFLNWLYPIMALYIISYVINMIISLVRGKLR